MSENTRPARSAWAPILAGIEQALARQGERLSHVPETAALSALPVPAPADVRLDRVEACVARAEEECRAADGLLEEAAAAMAAWQERAATLHRRLAEYAR